MTFIVVNAYTSDTVAQSEYTRRSILAYFDSDSFSIQPACVCDIVVHCTVLIFLLTLSRLLSLCVCCDVLRKSNFRRSGVFAFDL